jgi:lysophosphatidylcholine acyltransferase/lyso-PAF acetyltransferase
LLIFPEGTTTSGRHLIKFKRGAFDSLLPIKPYIIKSKNTIFDTSTGSSDLGVHFIIFLCFLYHTYEIIDLPVIEANEFIMNNFNVAEKNSDSVEKFIEVTRSIMSEISGFEKSEKGVRDNFEYSRLIDDKPLKQTTKDN